ncbi:hypothetical protein GCM10023153_21080 [Ornithinibacter aureus]|uniref:Sigma-70 family RNA polymerase sigma factor n=1 Tax=Ornithinibacter aureus TaxID=622664 RepID=A0ABP8JWR7_9MICO|nr:RNA polymerase RpoE-like sigma-24 subunit [Ornithinibacter aureus]
MGTVSGTAELLAEVASAVDAGDPTGARRAASEVDAGIRDDLWHLLATRAAAGSVVAAEVLLVELDESGMVRRFARGALLDESAIDDVCQDSLISIAASLESFRGDAKVSTWVHSIVRRRIVDHLRRQRATAPLPDSDTGPGERMSSLLATRATVRDALAALPEPYRTPVTLRDLEGLAYADVADRLDLPLGTVKGQISRGRALLAASLREPGVDLT